MITTLEERIQGWMASAKQDAQKFIPEAFLLLYSGERYCLSYKRATYKKYKHQIVGVAVRNFPEGDWTVLIKGTVAHYEGRGITLDCALGNALVRHRQTEGDVACEDDMNP